MKIEDKPYLGKGWAFPPHFEKSSGTALEEPEEDIQQSLEILFSTKPGERLFRFDYGCAIHEWVFSSMNLSEKTLITDAIEQAILNGEPRITLDSIDVGIKDQYEGILWLDITYTIKTTNSRKNMVYPFYFKEGTDTENRPIYS